MTIIYNVPVPPAKITDRFLAYLIDTFPFIVLYYAGLMLVVLYAPGAGARVIPRLAAGVFALYLLYQALGNAAGATPGKRLLGLKVVGADGQECSLKAAIARALGVLFSTPLFNLGYLWALFQPDSRSLHDLLAGTMVVEEEEKAPEQTRRNALLAFAALTAIVAATFWLSASAPSRADLDAVSRAQKAMDLLGEMQGQYRAKHGQYASRLSELALETSDPEEFSGSLFELLDFEGFGMRGGAHFKIVARAKDRRHTQVSAGR